MQVGLLVAGLTPIGWATAVARQDDPLAATTQNVNVELILDVSGSMSEPLGGAGDQTRMEAAQAALRAVIDRIPERDGLNVGLRIYGHEGSSRREDRDVSCQATALRVPLAGVDKAALLAEVEAAEPTGWTPLALALEAAGHDFAGGGESVTNAVIMVTDGEETCGGDPCAVAGTLQAADVALTTHVVGFALTAEQQEAVSCIAEEGGGQLFSADDADSLSAAVFSALEEVEPAVVQSVATPAAAVPMPGDLAIERRGYVGGNAFDLLAEAPEGELAVVAVGPGERDLYDGTLVPVIIHNNSGAEVANLRIEASAAEGGEFVAAGAAMVVRPRAIEDGGYALAQVYFEDIEIADDAALAFELSAEANAEIAAGTDLDLTIDEVSGDGASIVGIVSNAHAQTADGFLYATFACFDGAGQVIGVVDTATAGEELAAGEMAHGARESFVVPTDLLTSAGEPAPCAAYLVAVASTSVE